MALTVLVMAHHIPDDSSDGCQRSDGLSVEPSKENFLYSGVTADLTNRHLYLQKEI
ncbi:hypothetical protein HAX54_028955, partial [Datura stramonium]|nr:hypothetical protein [Datura stramonium]